MMYQKKFLAYFLKSVSGVLTTLLTATPVLAMDDTQAPPVSVKTKVKEITERKETKSSTKKVMQLPSGATMRPKLLQQWFPHGLLKTDPIPVTPGHKLTVHCVFPPATEGTDISFVNTAENGFYPGGIRVQLGETAAIFSSVVPDGEIQTCLAIRNPLFDGITSRSLGIIEPTSLTIQDENPLFSRGTQKKIKPTDLLQDWKALGLLKTKPILVRPGQRLTVNCDLDVLTKTAISFINTAQNGYYEGGVVVETPIKNQLLTFSSVVPDNQTQTWLVFRDPLFDGSAELTLGVVVNKVYVTVE